MSTQPRIPPPQDVTDVIPRRPAMPGGADPLTQWVQLFEACSRSAIDAAERASAAWVEAQALLWLTPWQWCWPTLPGAPGREDFMDEDTNKLVAGTVPPQPFQEAAREMMALGWRGMDDWRQWWGPWNAWAGQAPAQHLH